MSEHDPISRRRFVTSAIALGSSTLLGDSKQPSSSSANMDIATLRKACRGLVVTPEDADFKSKLYGKLWNRLVPDRFPDLIVCAADEDDVVHAIRFARDNKCKVTVRGGGHNWCQPSLRNGGMLIDLAQLNKVLSIDADARKAIVQPVVSNREFMTALQPHGLAFPYGHCPDVKLSGYLLGGGISWNMGVWGPAARSVEAIEIVTATGYIITANEHEHADLYWAALGAGYGFFGVAVKYHLKLHSLPKAIYGAKYFYVMEDAAEVADWLGKIAPSLSSRVELVMLLTSAPPELQKEATQSGGRVCIVPATVFADSSEQALEDLKPLDECPFLKKCLTHTPPEPLDFGKLFDASLKTWLPGMRCKVNAAYSDAEPGELVRIAYDALAQAPSPHSFVLLALPTGPHHTPVHAKPAYSMSGRCYWGPWTQWSEASGDAANAAWHNAFVAQMQPYISGYYIGESDTVSNPSAATGSFSADNWKRLADLRDRYDPDRVFFGYFDGLSER